MLNNQSNTQSLNLKLDYTGMIKSFRNPSGWTHEKLLSLQPLLTKAQQDLIEKRENGELDFSKILPSMQNLLPEIIEYADWAANQFENFVVLGIGGSALGPMAVHQALTPYYYNECSLDQRQGRPRIYIIDNIDPSRFNNLLEIIDIKKTLFNVITKSGNTSETMAQFMIIRDYLRREIGEGYEKNIVVTTDAEKGNLLPIAIKEGYKRFEIPKGIGGRFSELTPVGLLPAVVCGIDVNNLLNGAIAIDDKIRSNLEISANPAQLRAALSLLAWQDAKNISVFMPYIDGLKTIADWYAQLWAESLGKRINRNGQEVFTGQTPVKALGVTDQHSQIQLYTEGPNDKVITFLTVEKFEKDISIPELELTSELNFLSGHTLAELLTAEQKATEYALSLAGRLHQKIIIPSVDAYSIGQLIVLLEWETAFMGELLNINAFDQPGVEEGKIGTYALMGKQGYINKKKEIEDYSAKQYIL